MASYRNISHFWVWPALVTSLYLTYLLQTVIFNAVISWHIRSWHQSVNFEGHNSTHNTDYNNNFSESQALERIYKTRDYVIQPVSAFLFVHLLLVFIKECYCEQWLLFLFKVFKDNLHILVHFLSAIYALWIMGP